MAKSKPIDFTQHYKQKFTEAPMLQIQFFRNNLPNTSVFLPAFRNKNMIWSLEIKSVFYQGLSETHYFQIMKGWVVWIHISMA